MCRKRKDGVRLKKCDPMLRMTSYIMPHRYDAQVFCEGKIKCENIDAFIKEEAEKGNRFRYMHIVIAGLVRMYAMRPKMNRFIMNRRIYSRNGITVCFTVKKTLQEDAPETTLKLKFTGKESIYEIKEIIDKAIEENKKIEDNNDTDKLMNSLLKLPNGFLKFVMKLIIWLDNRGLLPKKLIEASPFHTTLFLTNMKSLGSDYVYHHLYDFGTTSQFISMGKEHIEPYVENDELTQKKIMKLGFNIDERICDGFYYAKGIKIGTRFIENPALMREPLENIVEDNGL